MIQSKMTQAPSFSLGSNWGSQVGWNDGTINNAIHLPPERPETPPTPFESIPFERDPDFVPRGDILDQIERRCAEPPHRAALVGLGGVGKSQLAIQFAHQARQQSPGIYVFWAHASTQARFEEAYRGIADSLRLPRRHDPKVDVLRLVADWLSRKENGRWLLILDNADNVDIFYPKSPSEQSITTTSSKPRGLASFLPQCSHGRIVITSRSRDAAQRLTGSHWNILPVPAMDNDQAKQLLKNKLQDRYEEEVASGLVHALECMPLAITHAAAYILRAPHMSPSAYLDAFQTSDNAKASLLNKNMGDLRRDASAANSVVITWQITFEQIQRERPSAADLLSLMSFFNPQGIPKWVLQKYKQSPTKDVPNLSYQRFQQKPKRTIIRRMFQSYQQRREKQKSIGHSIENQRDTGNNDLDHSVEGQVDTQNNQFEDDMEILHEYSLVGLNAEEDSYEMHALVQFCTRVWISSNNDIRRWSGTFLRLMSREFPSGNYENWIKCQQLIPHIETIIETEPQNKESANDWAHLLVNAGWYSWQLGMYEVAERRLRRSIDIRERILNKKQPDAQSLSILALVLHSQGKYSEAEKMNRQALDSYEKWRGKEHPFTLMSVGNLTSILRDQGKYDEAEQMQRRALDGHEKALGKGHIDTLTSSGRLASILQHQGKYDEAEQMERRALEGYKKVLEEEHPYILATISNLALILQSQGKYDEAEKIQRPGLDGHEKALGKEHPDTLTSVSRLASILQFQGKYEEAEQMERRALDGREKALGREHPHTLLSLHNLVLILQYQGKHEEASLIRRRVDGRDRTLN